MNPRLTAALLIAAAVCTNLAFTVLGTVFDYPDVLQQPVDTILTLFRASATTVAGWFTVLALSAALFAPIAVGVARLAPGRAMRIALPVGIGAAVVQVVGLLRWPVLVPGYAAAATSADPGTAAAARESFTLAHEILGHLVGETFGYLLTGAWTLLVLVALGRAYAGRWFVALGAVSAVLILAGLLSPFGLPGVDLANLVGYVGFSLWLIAFAVVILVRTRGGRRVAGRSGLAAADR
jgi:hypothetical protein